MILIDTSVLIDPHFPTMKKVLVRLKLFQEPP
jgi:hypothetical protein